MTQSPLRDFAYRAALVAALGSFTGLPGLAAEKEDVSGPFASFHEVDRNQDGFIDVDEANAYHGRVFAVFDANKDGSLTLFELLHERPGPMALGFGARETYDMKKDRFELWNRNGDDVLSRAEFLAGTLSAFARADANGDSKFDQAEFRARLGM